MRDPRTKRADQEELLDKRHQEWLRSLKIQRYANKPVVIQLRSNYSGKTAAVLSEREIEILQLISFGYSTKQIAEKLSLSDHTIRNHRKNMLTRSRCGNLAELVRVAITEDLL